MDGLGYGGLESMRFGVVGDLEGQQSVISFLTSVLDTRCRPLPSQTLLTKHTLSSPALLTQAEFSAP